MANIVYRDGTGATKYRKADGAGTNADPQIAASKDNGPAWTPSYARKDSADLSTISDLTAAPTSGQKIVIDDLVVSVGAAMTVTFTEETSGTVLVKLYMAANTTEVVPLRDGRKLDTADKKVRVQTSTNGNIFIHMGHHSEA